MKATAFSKYQNTAKQFVNENYSPCSALLLALSLTLQRN